MDGDNKYLYHMNDETERAPIPYAVSFHSECIRRDLRTAPLCRHRQLFVHSRFAAWRIEICTGPGGGGPV